MTITRTGPRLEYHDLPHLLARMTGDEKHDPASVSTLDVLWVLYDQVLCVGPESLDDPKRDRFFLSKGHGPMAFFAVLAAKGFFPSAWLSDFGTYESPLGLHPDAVLIPGVEISSGSLGHGLPMAVGHLLGLRAQGINARVVVLLGDAELDEGSNAEAIAAAGALGLAGLTVVVVDNQSASLGWRGGIRRRFEVEGWHGTTVDGRSHEALRQALSVRPAVPNVVVAIVEKKS